MNMNLKTWVVFWKCVYGTYTEFRWHFQFFQNNIALDDSTRFVTWLEKKKNQNLQKSTRNLRIDNRRFMANRSPCICVVYHYSLAICMQTRVPRDWFFLFFFFFRTQTVSSIQSVNIHYCYRPRANPFPIWNSNSKFNILIPYSVDDIWRL